MSGLRENTTNNFVEKGQKYRSTQIITVWVENYGDVPFWYSFFSELMPNEKFDITAPTTGERGKDYIVKNVFGQEGKDFLLCLDSDYDYILQTDIATQIQNSPYIFQTYAYAIENFRCSPKNLKNIVIQATLKTDFDFDFRYFLEEYSKIVYPLFLQFLAQYPQRKQFEEIFITLPLSSSISIDFNPLKEIVKQNLLSSSLDSFQKELQGLGLTEHECYLFLRGHNLEHMMFEILKELCKGLIGERIESIKNERSENVKDYTNKIKAIELHFKNNDVNRKTNYKDVFSINEMTTEHHFIEKIKEDILAYKLLFEKK